jgi:hypothetical protein
MRKLDLVGQKFSRWLVLEYAGTDKGQHTLWKCKCDCGTEKIVHGSSLLGGSQSCGCKMIEAVRAANTTHGETVGKRYSPRFRMLQGAKERAQRKSIPFFLNLEDIVIPELCPLLGIPLMSGSGRGGMTGNSPTLDRKIPELGYVKGNVWVISHRANSIKRDASLAELEMLVERLRANV